jgi:hypothetical protein
MKLRNVNTTDIRSAIELGCTTMQNVFNADDNGIPFFKSVVLPRAYLAFHEIHSESHVPGRHLNALLTASDLIGVPVDQSAIEKHARAAFFSFSGPLPLPMNRDRAGGPIANFTEHNVREGFHALYALVRYQRLARALELAERSIDTLLRLWDPERGWDRKAFEKLSIRWTRDHTFIVGIGRAIGPLVKYFRATGYGPALDLALLLKNKATTGFFHPDGAYSPERFGTHTHSTTCVMSSLAQLADLTQDAALMARVKAFYDNGLWEIRDGLGWVIESSRQDANPDRGECNNTGDIIETALCLGRWGYTDYYHDAERILRGHLLPAQLRDSSFIKDPPNPDKVDGLRDVAARHLGAFGFPAPYGHRPVGLDEVSFNMDIVGGAVASLCEAYRESVTSGQAGHRVNLLFARQTRAVSVDPLPGNAGVSVTIREPGALWVRIPPWAATVLVTDAGAGVRWRMENGYLFMPEPPVGKPIGIRYQEVSSEIILKHRTRNIQVRLSGDRVIAMQNFGASLTYFDPA